MLFTSMKADVDKINRWLFSKEKDEFGDNLYCGEGALHWLDCAVDGWWVPIRSLEIKFSQRQSRYYRIVFLALCFCEKKLKLLSVFKKWDKKKRVSLKSKEA